MLVAALGCVAVGLPGPAGLGLRCDLNLNWGHGCLNSNLNSPPRFDLIFILLDRPEDPMEGPLMDHVLAMHSGERRVSESGLGK